MRLFFAATLLAVSGSLAGNAQLRPRDRFPITTDLVAAKLIATFAQRGILLDAKQIALSTPVTATEEMPSLQVRSVEKLGSLRTSTAETTSSAVKLACTKATVCLPFYAVVTLNSAPDGAALEHSAAGLLSASGSETPRLIKAGDHLTLLVDSGSAHIQMAVVSMQNGAANQQIRVRSADRKQMFDALVLSATTVKGVL